MNIATNLKINLEKLQSVVLEKNTELNLTSITDPQDFWQKHILDSLEIANISEVREILENKSLVADVGSGAGFPGLVLALTFKMANFDLIESKKKKVDAISNFIRFLKIKNAKSIWARSEDLGRSNGTSGDYDLVTARSVAYLPKLIELTAHLVKKNGLLAFYKLESSEELKEGISATSKYGLKYIKTHIYNLENSPQKRAIYLFRRA